jgi:hypothetical protein
MTKTQLSAWWRETGIAPNQKPQIARDEEIASLNGCTWFFRYHARFTKYSSSGITEALSPNSNLKILQKKALCGFSTGFFCEF